MPTSSPLHLNAPWPICMSLIPPTVVWTPAVRISSSPPFSSLAERALLGRCRLLGVIEDVLGHRKAKNFTETFSVLTLFKVAYLYLHLMHLQTAAGIVFTDYEYWRWCRILSNLVDELRHLEHLQAQQDDDPIIAVAGQCLDLLASHPAIGTFIGTLPELWYLTNYGLEDLFRALQAVIPKHKALQHPILDTLPIKEHILEFSPKTEPSV